MTCLKFKIHQKSRQVLFGVNLERRKTLSEVLCALSTDTSGENISCYLGGRSQNCASLRESCNCGDSCMFAEQEVKEIYQLKWTFDERQETLCGQVKDGNIYTWTVLVSQTL